MSFRAKACIALPEVTVFNLPLLLYCSQAFYQRQHHGPYLQHIAETADSDVSLDDESRIAPSCPGILRLLHHQRWNLRWTMLNGVVVGTFVMPPIF